VDLFYCVREGEKSLTSLPFNKKGGKGKTSEKAGRSTLPAEKERTRSRRLKEGGRPASFSANFRYLKKKEGGQGEGNAFGKRGSD